MNIIVAGSRNYTDYSRVCKLCKQWFREGDVMLNGMCASGVDRYARMWAAGQGFRVDEYHPHWNKHGRAAGPIRNREMAKDADVLIAIWDGQSSGTKSMIDEALKAGVEVHVYR